MAGTRTSRKDAVLSSLSEVYPDTSKAELEAWCHEAGWCEDVVKKRMASGKKRPREEEEDEVGLLKVPETPDERIVEEMVSAARKGVEYEKWGGRYYCFWRFLKREVGAAVDAPREDCKRFTYNAVKSKVVQTAAQGPPDGSTWEWFLIANLSVTELETATLTGDKFQAGWVRSAKDATDAATLNQRRATMVDSVLKGSQNAHGLQRAGVPTGFRHHWSYSDSFFGPAEVTNTEWAEEKHDDRWTVKVNFTWKDIKGSKGADDIPPGDYLVVADQRAEKLNKNQYDTSMAGWLYALPSDPAKVKARRDALLEHHIKKHYRKPLSETALGAWLMKKPKKAA